MLALLLPWLLLGGCERFGDRVADMYDSKISPDTPIDWWHQLQGGVIADERPPPPGISDPYPNLGQIPARPTPPDAATRRALSARLAAERDRAQQDALRDPITPVPPLTAPPAPGTPAAPVRPAAPGVPTRPPAPQPDPGASMAVLEAASPPPAPALAPPPAPAAPPPPPAFTAPARPPPRAAAAPVPSEPVPSGPIPALPAAPPPLPALAGIPATTTAPATPRLLPSVRVAFARGSAVMPAPADAALRGLAARRANGPIQVSASGDAASATPEAQAAALPLALRRAQAIAAVLLAAGVPQAALRTDAVALGRGGEARLVN